MEEREIAQPPAPARQESEKKSGLKLSDIYTEEGYQSFRKDLESSQGKCLILVHPFYSFYKEDADALLEDPQEWQLKEFVDRLKNLVFAIKDRNVNLPILILERTERGMMHKNAKASSLVTERVEKDLKHILDCNEGDFFFTETIQGAPVPLLSLTEVEQFRTDGWIDHAKVMEDFVLKLKKAGVSHALIAGSNFGGRSFFKPIYRDALYAPTDGLFARSEWRLKDFYDQRFHGEIKHPFQIISPRGCVADVIRSLARWGEGIKLGITQVTYPQQIPRTDQLIRPPHPLNVYYWQAVK